MNCQYKYENFLFLKIKYGFIGCADNFLLFGALLIKKMFDAGISNK
jgi:hypothetical protein